MNRFQKVSAAAALAASMLGGGIYLDGFSDRGMEGREAGPYQDVGGVWTDCYGNTKDVQRERIRSEKECKELLSGEALRIGYKLEPHLTGVSSTTLAAWISFTYNVGDSAFLNSTALRKWKSGDKIGACNEMFRWVYVGKVRVKGLYNRRVVENKYCLKGLYE